METHILREMGTFIHFIFYAFIILLFIVLNTSGKILIGYGPALSLLFFRNKIARHTTNRKTFSFHILGKTPAKTPLVLARLSRTAMGHSPNIYFSFEAGCFIFVAEEISAKPWEERTTSFL